jgi:hypothetical protein
METVSCSTTVQKILIINLTITTLHKSKTNGSAIKENFKWTVNMEKVKLNSATDNTLKEILITT